MAKILIVDDNQVSHQILRVLLERDNHEVVSVFNGQEALDKLEVIHVDLVITDVNMPIMDGLELLKRLRQDQRFTTVPVIVLTASGKSKIPEIASREGATGFLTQPFSSWELKQLVRESLPV
ncbi:MAG: response regulator [Anaerolineales bacterium]|nr:response regulator [Anaerolineales bacterium]